MVFGDGGEAALWPVLEAKLDSCWPALCWWAAILQPFYWVLDTLSDGPADPDPAREAGCHCPDLVSLQSSIKGGELM